MNRDHAFKVLAEACKSHGAAAYLYLPELKWLERNGYIVRKSEHAYVATEKGHAAFIRGGFVVSGGRRTATKRKRSYASRSKTVGRAKKQRTTRLRRVRVAKKRRGYGVMIPFPSPRKKNCSHNRMVENHGPGGTWKCADCGHVYGS